MTAWLKRVDVTGAVELTQLPDLEVEGRPALRVELATRSPRKLALVSDGGRWHRDDHGAKVLLAHGDALELRDGAVLVYLERPELSEPRLEAAIDQAPEDAQRVQVWIDWLIEHGDPLGEDLARGRQAPTLEGLAGAVDDGRLELEWRHGLLASARLRCTGPGRAREPELLVRLLSLRVARWLRLLTVDVATWEPSSGARLQADAATFLSLITKAKELRALRQLSLGYLTQEPPTSSLFQAMLARLPARFPGLQTPVEEILPLARRAWLETLFVPEGVDFRHEGGAPRRIPLTSGLWVGSSREGSLRALAPGVAREGASTALVVRQEAPQWCLVPSSASVRLNAHPTPPIHLLPGDLIEVSGARFRFDVEY